MSKNKTNPEIQPLVSVIIPLFNAAPYISDCLESVINQTYVNIEIIVVDDGSTDCSLEVVKSIGDERIHIIKTENKGAPAARNIGFQNSNGSLIQFLDADDLISTHKIGRQVNEIKAIPNSAAICSTHHFYHDVNKEICNDDYLFSTDKPEELFKVLWGANGFVGMIAAHAWLVHRSLIQQYGLWDESLKKDADGEFYARICMNASEIILTEGVKCYYRRFKNGNNQSAKMGKEQFTSNLRSTELKQEYQFKKVNSDESKLAIATQYKLYAMAYYPKHRNLCKEAMKRCEVLGGSNYVYGIRGCFISRVNRLAGWKVARWLAFYKTKLLCSKCF
ncbi:MAG: glycosyltransferase [Carboxylicivirga sp.]|jgi:glycosyltransferase involved in cell wall biosynthesis|nr:glycosyltransferase [Carboxylicivirga sp.]MCT4646773.1 glycosyltransferase [Carboxylicivirga sp.]